MITVEDTQNILVEKKKIKMKEGKLPKDFDPTNLTNLFVDQFVTWDEFHRKLIIGSDYVYPHNRYKDHIMKFPRKNNGKFDALNRTYSKEKATMKKCKFIDDVCLCLGNVQTFYLFKEEVTQHDRLWEEIPEQNRMSEVTERGAHIRVG